MRILVVIALLSLPVISTAQPPAAAPPGQRVFLSPMGEPFRSAGPADNVGTWFSAADRDSDGGLSLAELEADAARFFAALDSDSNLELGPAEIARYENEVAPEVQLGLQMRGSGFGDWRGGGSRQRRVETFDRGIEGAGRYAFLNIPQPVIAADKDLNRGVTGAEFRAAAEERFGLLDKDRDGRLTRAELPALPLPRLRRPGRSDRPPAMRPRGY
jgi:hypothetical protein